MSLRTTLEKLLSLLTKYPNAEYQAKLKTTVGKLQKAATDFQDQLELSTVENSVEYATLAGLLSDPAKKKMVNLAWANKHLKRLNLEEPDRCRKKQILATGRKVRICKRPH